MMEENDSRPVLLPPHPLRESLHLHGILVLHVFVTKILQWLLSLLLTFPFNDHFDDLGQPIIDQLNRY